MDCHVLTCCDDGNRMPSNNIIMVNNPLGKFDDTQREYQFRVPPKMTKHDLLEYFQKVYNVNNIKTIQTVNYDGKRKRRGQRTVREKAYKKVNVTVFLPGDPAPKKGDINHRFLGNGGNSPSGHPKGDNKWGEDSRIYNRWIRWKIATEGEQGTESSESEDKNEVKPEGGFLSNVLGR